MLDVCSKSVDIKMGGNYTNLAAGLEFCSFSIHIPGYQTYKKKHQILPVIMTIISLLLLSARYIIYQGKGLAC